jgi:formamidopyrimidine-DNA glycosylase
MPELPEVEAARTQLERWAAGRTLRAIRMVDRAVVRRTLSTKPSDAVADGEAQLAVLVGEVAGVPSRYGKRLGWTFGSRALLCHFGMTGAWVRSLPGAPQPANARLALEFDELVLWFVDSRRFGCVVVVDASEVPRALRAGTGPDAVLEPMDGRALRAAVSSRKPVKVALMEQDRLAGLGNIHAAESLFRAGIAPKRRADALGPAEWDRLAAGIVTQLTETIASNAETDELVYVNMGGPNPFVVYQREGEGCAVCGAIILAEELAGRTTFWCPTCQRDDGAHTG